MTEPVPSPLVAAAAGVYIRLTDVGFAAVPAVNAAEPAIPPFKFPITCLANSLVPVTPVPPAHAIVCAPVEPSGLCV